MTAPTTEQIMRLCDVGRQTGYDLRKYHGHGHLEKVYENGLPHRLRKRGIRVEQQCVGNTRSNSQLTQFLRTMGSLMANSLSFGHGRLWLSLKNS